MHNLVLTYIHLGAFSLILGLGIAALITGNYGLALFDFLIASANVPLFFWKLPDVLKLLKLEREKGDEPAKN